MMRSILLLSMFLALTSMSYENLERFRKPGSQDQRQEREVLYLPKSEALAAISFGFNNVLARTLWFNTISYFGKHYRKDKNYAWLENMCNLVIDLDQRADHVFEFCALMLAWEAKQYENSMAILKRMDTAFPQSWRPQYLMGINAMYFMQDNIAARDHFINASKKPNAPVFLARLAVKKLANLNSPETALAFLQSMIEQAKDPNQKKAFQEHLNKTRHTILLKRFQETVDDYHKTNGKFPATLSDLIKSSLLKDPFGGTYYITETGEVRSTSKVEGTTLFKYRPSPMTLQEATSQIQK